MNDDMKKKVQELMKEKLNIETGVSSIVRLGGLTNYNYKVVTPEGSYVVRLPGVGTEELISRYEESLSTRLANDIGIDAENLWFDEKTGMKITRYIEDAVTMNPELIKTPQYRRETAELFHKLHHSGKTIPVIFDVFEKIVEYENLLKAEEENYFWDDYAKIKEEVYGLEHLYKSYGVFPVMCHNDPLCENFVGGRDRMYLVDWEYAGMNDPMWDIADVFIEGNFSEEEEALFQSFYFQGAMTEEEGKRILMNKIFLDFLWSLWGKQRTACGEDLHGYADERYERAKQNLKKLTAITAV